MQHEEQLRAITAASEAVTAGLELNDVLQGVVDASRRLVRARYAALGVLNETGDQIEQFITSGMDEATRRRIGPYPQGLGLLGHIINHRKPLRVDKISADPRAAGFPPHHPIMTSLLGAPIISRDRVFGNLYLTDKITDSGGGNGNDSAVNAQVAPFTQEDQQLVELFARQAAIAIENALLHRQSRQLVIAQERERFAMDLHDGIIQSVYAVGLTLEEARYQLDRDTSLAGAAIDDAVVHLNEVTADIRSYILNLRTKRLNADDLGTGLHNLVRELRAHTFLSAELDVDPDVNERLTEKQTGEMLHIAQEALNNIRQHARARRVIINLTYQDNNALLRIVDDGSGFDHAAVNAGNGLGNMQERAAALGGYAEVRTIPQEGTLILISIPFILD
ncbi:MAG: GAF domain-containing sensor histidine kinase [Caldilineaceae bacterium]|nr:GAF domain-containing sensor histidine kinase [Caldilineaceae bacterium]